MLLGPPLPLDPGWRVVEDDLLQIARQVKEYDNEASLVREDESGHLGLAHFNRRTELVPGGALMLARPCIDWTSEETPPLTGTPDRRVLIDMRYADSHQIKDLRSWGTRQRDQMARRKLDEERDRKEWSRHQAHEYVWRRNRVDLGRKPTIAVSRGVT